MNINLKIKKNKLSAYLTMLWFLIGFILIIGLAADNSVFTYEADSILQETSQEQKPPEEKQEEKKEEKQIDEQLQERVTPKDQEMLPENILKNQVDPFKSPIDKAAEEKAKEGKLVGVAAMSVEELRVVGIVEMGKEYIAVVEGPDNIGYFLRVNDEVINGKVVEINMDRIVFEQDITDPYALKKSRRIIKKIHTEQ
jgi:Tfp pilus assembly protein PilP